MQLTEGTINKQFCRITAVEDTESLIHAWEWCHRKKSYAFKAKPEKQKKNEQNKYIDLGIICNLEITIRNTNLHRGSGWSVHKQFL